MESRESISARLPGREELIGVDYHLGVWEGVRVHKSASTACSLHAGTLLSL